MSKKRKKTKTSKEESKTREDMWVMAEKKSGPGISNIQRGKWIKLGGLILAVLVVVGYMLRGLLVVAVVNGKPIFRQGFVRQLESRYGQQLLDEQITKKLVEDEAVKQGVTVADAEVDDQMAKIEEQITLQGQNLDMLLAAQGLNRYDLRNQIRIQKLIEQLLPETEEPTEEEIVQLLEEQADTFPEEMTEDEKRDAVVNQLTQQKESQRVDDWLKSLKDKADINYWRDL